MSLNWKEIDAILDELKLEGSHIQNVRQPDYHSLIFELYKPGEPFTLLISLNQGKTRLHRISEKKASRIRLQRFTQFLRSRVKGGRIRSASQLDSERIVKMEITRGSESTILWIRLWGSNSNLIATDNQGRIFDVFYRRPQRAEVSGKIYDPRAELSGVKSLSDKSHYRVRDLPGKGDFNSKIANYYEHEEKRALLQNLRTKVKKIVDKKETALLGSLEQRQKQYKQYEDWISFKQYGDLIMSNLNRIKKEDSYLITENFFSNNQEIQIPLDTTLSPQENAQKYYHQYKKSKSGLAFIKEEMENQRGALSLLQEERQMLLQSEDPQQLSEYIQKQPRGIVKKPGIILPGLQFRSGEHTILVGRTAKENDQLLRKHVRGNDYWLHTRDFPGAYVFIKNLAGKSIPLDVLLDAGNLAVFYSKAKNSAKADLYYTQVKYLRRAKNAKQGTVLPTQEKNLSIQLDRKRLDRLLNRDF